MLDGYGEPVEGLLIKYLAEHRRDLQFAQGLFDSDLPDDGGTDENEVASIGQCRSDRLGKSRMVIQPPQQHMGIQQ
jgi:hypothetical protein